MRLDKFLKVSSIIKRRTVAHEIIDRNKVLVNKKVAKPSYDVKNGDVIEITLVKEILTIEVKDTSPTIPIIIIKSRIEKVRDERKDS